MTIRIIWLFLSFGGPLHVGVLVIRAVVFGVYITDFWKLTNSPLFRRLRSIVW